MLGKAVIAEGGKKHARRRSERRIPAGKTGKQRPVAGLAPQPLFLVLAQQRKGRRDIGLQRKGVQQALGEGVNGLHLEPARRVERMGEKPARPAQHRRGWRQA